jgi:hypothetical protein
VLLVAPLKLLTGMVMFVLLTGTVMPLRLRSSIGMCGLLCRSTARWRRMHAVCGAWLQLSCISRMWRFVKFSTV